MILKGGNTMEKKDVGVIVARFQVPYLTEGHEDLIQKVIDSNYRTIIVLGLSSVKCTVYNPLDFEARRQMILSKYPDITVVYIKDTYSDVDWSNTLDKIIKDITGPNDEITLYGSRDSFIKYYTGTFDCTELEQKVFVSGTQIRKIVSKKVKGSNDFRKGVIWSVNNQYYKCLPTVDVCIYKKDTKGNIQILLGKRNSEPMYRFIGGFVPSGETFEETVVRETKEESSVTIKNIKYLKSFLIDDWRYKKEADKITTSLFVSEYNENRPVPGDDIDELRWFNLNDDIIFNIVQEHKEMINFIIDYFGKEV